MNLRQLFGKHKKSEEGWNITTYDDHSEIHPHSQINRYTTLSSHRRADLNTSMMSRHHSDNSELPDISTIKDSVFIPTPHSPSFVEQIREEELEEIERQENMERLRRISESVRNVDQFYPIKRKRLYQGIVIISEREFFIDIFRTKVKFYISAIELATKMPYMIELYLNQGK